MADDLPHIIRERAYHLWLAAGGKDGEADGHWLAAERAVLAEFALKSAPPGPVADQRAEIIAPSPKGKPRVKARRAAR